MIAFENVLAALEARGSSVRRTGDLKAQAQCPAHEDRKASLTVGVGDDGRVLLHCHAGCQKADVLAASQLNPSDLFEHRNGNGPEIAYRYTDEAGALLFEVVRKQGKKFPQRRPDGKGGVIWNIEGTRRVLYRLPRVIEAVKAGKRIWIVEGEKDVAALEAVGEVATCNPGGAGKWRPEYAEVLRGAKVAIVADKDVAGRKHARDIARSLEGVADQLQVGEAKTGKDAADHLAAGHGIGEFVPCDLAEPDGELVGRPIIRASEISKKRLRWTWRGRLALGYLAVWCGAGDIGKSTFAAWVIRQLTHGQLPGEFEGEPQTALIICTEDGKDDMWLPRLEAVGADLERVEFLDYPRDWNLKDGISSIDRAVTDAGVPLIFVDALMSHMPDGHGGENTRSPTFVRAALQPLADLCKQRKVTALFGLHPRKAGGDTFADVVQESGVFTQLPRVGLLFGCHPDDLELPRDQQRRVILRGKGNVGRDPGALSFRIAEKFLDYGDDDLGGIADGVGYITDVQTCHVTERQLLHPKPDNDRPLTKREQAEQLIAMALLDGAWHLAAPIRSRLGDLGLNHNANVDTATANLHVEKRKQGGTSHGPWEWQIPNSSNSTPNPDSWSPRATLDRLLTVDPKNPPNPNEDGKGQRVGPVERTTEEGSQESRVGQAPRAHAHARHDANVMLEPVCGHAEHRAHDSALPSGEAWICGVCHPPLSDDVRWREGGPR